MSVAAGFPTAPQVPLRYLVDFNPRPTGRLKAESVYLPMEAIGEFGVVDTAAHRSTQELAQGYSFVSDGDVAYAKVTPCFENGKGFVASGLPNGYAFATTEVTVMRPRERIEQRYLAWLMQSDGFRGPAIGAMSGAGGLKRVPESYAASFRAPLLELAEQRAIADYLDGETARIDAFIAKNEELITLLTERRLATIRLATTKGLDPSMETRDSGVDWLGMVPVHWRVSRVSRWYDVVLGKMLDEAKFATTDGERIPYIRAANVRQGALDLDDVNSMPFTRAERAKFDLRSGDLIVVEGGASYGVAAHIDEDMPGWGFQKTVNRVRSIEDGSTEFLGYALEVLRAAGVLGTLADASTIPHLTAEKLERLVIAVPPPTEQQDIVRWLDRSGSDLAKATRVAAEGILLARERRAALISAAVTGKIDVGVAA